jgi:hypothetical protein
MDKKQVVQSQANGGFVPWLFQLLKMPVTIYKFFFEKEIRQSLNGKVVLITGNYQAFLRTSDTYNRFVSHRCVVWSRGGTRSHVLPSWLQSDHCSEAKR